MATTAGHRLTLDPMGKYSNAFFLETTNQIDEIYLPTDNKGLEIHFPVTKIHFFFNLLKK
jgi:hypothetical protein